MEIINNKIIKDYILGKSSPRNIARLLDWLNLSEKNGKMLFLAEQFYNEGKQSFKTSDEDMEQAEADIMSRIMQYEDNGNAKIKHMSFLRYAAAALVLVAGGALAMWSISHLNEKDMVSITAKHKQELTLPDSTKVWLNQNATISYAKNFDGDTREVQLTGEALFDVVKNPGKPFIVSSGNVSAKVLGTVFDFNTKCDGNSEEVTLLEGRLEVADNIGKNKVTINPNQKIVIDKNSHTMEVREVYAPIDAVWHDGMIPFRSMSVDEIAEVLEQLYGVNITIDNNIDRNQTYTGTVPYHSNADRVLRNLS